MNKNITHPKQMSRISLTKLMQASDPNGIWLDSNAKDEGMNKATKEEMINVLQRWADEEGQTLEQMFQDLLK